MDRLWLYAIIGIALWLIQKTCKLFTSPLRQIPGPLSTKLTRLPLKLSILTGNRIYYIHDLHRKYGPIVRISPDEVSISSLRDFKEIHRVGSPFLKSPWYQKFVMDRPPGMFDMPGGREHAGRRRLFARAFSKSELRRVWEGVVREKVGMAISQMKSDLDAVGGKGRCDVLKWWTFLATDVAGHLMFGEDFGMLQLGVKNEYIHVLESTMMGSGINSELPLVGFIGRHLPIPSIKAMFRASEYMSNYGRRAIINARTSSESSKNIFAGMIHESEKGSDSLTDEDVVTEAGNLIVAGSDTTAITLTYLVWAVLSQPQLQKELEGEVQDLAVDYDEAALENLPLLNAIIKETLRLYGAAPGSLPRAVPEGGATLGGHFIPEGITVSTQSWTMHRDENVFPNPDVFDASRWLKAENTNSQSLSQMTFSPFGAGARTCLGIHLAYMELRLAAAEFFREFRGVKLATDVTWETMRPENYFLIAPSGHRCEIVRG